MLQMIQKSLAEMIGTFSVIFVGGGSILLSEKGLIPAWCVPAAWGLMVCLMILVMGNVSGAHFNPAVTFAFAVSKRLAPGHVLFYWGSQFVGGILAVLLLRLIQRT